MKITFQIQVSKNASLLRSLEREVDWPSVPAIGSVIELSPEGSHSKVRDATFNWDGSAYLRLDNLYHVAPEELEAHGWH